MEKLGKKKTIILCSVLVCLFIADAIICTTVGPNTGKGVGKSYSKVPVTITNMLQCVTEI